MAEMGEKLMRSVLGGVALLRGVGARRRAPQEGPHRRRRHLRAAVPGRAARARVRHRPRALHAPRGARRRAHRRGRRADPVGPGQGRGGQGVRASARTIDLEKSFAYGNGTEDVEFLESVGRPTALNPTKELAAVAARARLAVASASSRAARPGVQEVVRTAAAYGGLTAGLYAGVGLGLLKRSRKAGMNTTMSLGSDVGLALARRQARRRRAKSTCGRPAGGVHLQPPELARRHDRHEAAARGRHRGGQDRRSRASRSWARSRGC